MAHANGYFDAEGLTADKPVLLRSWAQVIEAFISGQVNVVHLLSPMTVWGAVRQPRAGQGGGLETMSAGRA
ncbi:MAG: hypothetical protein WDN49_15595 [Acetobacteraceae bacterium]